PGSALHRKDGPGAGTPGDPDRALAESAQYPEPRGFLGRLAAGRSSIQRQARQRLMATVLTVDDSPSIRQMIKVTLEPAGHAVVEAGDGAQGLAKAQSSRPDLVITDLNMPTMNGLELIRALRKEPALTGLPIVFLTTESNDAV